MYKTVVKLEKHEIYYDLKVQKSVWMFLKRINLHVKLRKKNRM